MAGLIRSEKHHVGHEEMVLGPGASIQGVIYGHTLLGTVVPVWSKRDIRLSATSMSGSSFLLLGVMKMLLIDISVHEIPHGCRCALGGKDLP